MSRLSVNGPLLVGLGNPGRRYRATRHNLGADVVEACAVEFGISLKPANPLFAYGAGRMDDHPVALAIPTVFMNDSGRAVSALLSTHHLAPEEMVVIHDEMDLPVGRLRLKHHGRHGGHQGVRSIIDTLRTDRFYRMRLGIGRSPVSAEAADYVLSVVPREERLLVEQMTDRAIEAVRCIVLDGPETAMNRYNRRQPA
jgi:PTH1 family peptidyl-tRNA hydrolase